MKVFLFVICGLLSFNTLFADEGVGFVFFGDQGHGNKEQFDVAQGVEKFCSSHDCKFALILGDNFYDVGVKSTTDSQWTSKFEKPYKNLLFPFYAVLGNHDHLGNIQAQIDYSKLQKKWTLPGRYYRFSSGFVDFFGIDSDDYDDKQASWLESTMKESTANWRIVFGHHPIYSSGMHGGSNKMEKALVPLLQNPSDFYFCGHDHDLEVIERKNIKTVVSGAASEVRPFASSGKGTLYRASQLGFSYLFLKDNYAHLILLNKVGETLFQKTWTK